MAGQEEDPVSTCCNTIKFKCTPSGHVTLLPDSAALVTDITKGA